MNQGTQTYHSPLTFSHGQKYDDNPRADVVGLIGPMVRDILEIGCHTGATGALLKGARPGIRYCGIELNPEAAHKARERLDSVFVANIEQVNLEHLGLRPGSFDCIIFADVLEHLYDPWKVLATVREFLRPNGTIVASIPNVQNVTLIEQLVRGNWTYADCGLLDGTHIRFFTLAEINRLFSWTGFHIADCVATCLPPFPNDYAWPRDLQFGDVLLKNVTRDQAHRLYAFQYLIVAKRNEQWSPAATS
jgi:2-polyprenyl-3-methyl-5-hydroxy-6-metoxy-1,4-benzoquinol methylase